MTPVRKPTRGEKAPELLLQDMIQIYIIMELICNCAHHILYFMSNTKKLYIHQSRVEFQEKKNLVSHLVKSIDLLSVMKIFSGTRKKNKTGCQKNKKTKHKELSLQKIYWKICFKCK